jgi:hypothetical protein
VKGGCISVDGDCTWRSENSDALQPDWGAAPNAVCIRIRDFDEFRFMVPTRELLRIGNGGLPTAIPLGSRAA